MYDKEKNFYERRILQNSNASGQGSDGQADALSCGRIRRGRCGRLCVRGACKKRRGSLRPD